MSTLFRRFALLTIALCAFALLAACGPSNYVRLMYSPNTDAVLPKPDAPRVTVVMLQDQRQHQGIGERRDGTSFTPNSSVSDWVSRSLGEELARLGLQVTYATTSAQAQEGNPTYIVTGVIHDIWVKENSATSLSATVRMTVKLSSKKGVVYSENLSATQDRKALPSSSIVESLVAETLRDVLVPTAKKLYERMH